MKRLKCSIEDSEFYYTKSGENYFEIITQNLSLHIDSQFSIAANYLLATNIPIIEIKKCKTTLLNKYLWSIIRT